MMKDFINEILFLSRELKMRICVSVIRTDDGKFRFYQPTLRCEGQMASVDDIGEGGLSVLKTELSKYKHLIFMPEVSIINETKNYLRIRGMSLDNYIQNLWIEIGDDV